MRNTENFVLCNNEVRAQNEDVNVNILIEIKLQELFYCLFVHCVVLMKCCAI